MLSVFRQMEQQGSQDQKIARPLKEFTPPREPLRPTEDEEQESEDESAESPPPGPLKEDFYKEVGVRFQSSSQLLKNQKCHHRTLARMCGS